MKKDETKFKERVQKDLKELNNTWYLKTHEVSIRGIPDFLLCVCGTFIAIELKRSEDAPRNKLQEWTLLSIGHAGGMSFIAYPDNWEETFAVIKDVSESMHDNNDSGFDVSH